MKKKSVILLIIVLGLVLAGCTNTNTTKAKKEEDANPFVGKWEMDYDFYPSTEMIWNMDFQENNQMTLEIKGSSGRFNKDVGTYGFNGNILNLETSNGTVLSYHYTINEDTMELVDSNSNPTKFRKVTGDFKYPYIEETGEVPSQNTTIPQKEYTFTAGNYNVGQDISSGKYDVEWVSGRGNCFAGDMSETFGDNEHAIRNFKNLTLKTNDTIEVKGTLEIKFISK